MAEFDRYLEGAYDPYRLELYWFVKDIMESEPDLGQRKIWLHSRWYEDDHYFAWLDAAREVDARMSFCFLGRDVLYRKNVIRRMVDDGHEVGTHGFLHYLVDETTTRADLRADLQRCVDGLAELGVRPRGLWAGAKGYLNPDAANALVDVGLDWFSSVRPHDQGELPDGLTWVPAKAPHDVEMLFYHPRPAAEAVDVWKQAYTADSTGAFMFHLFTLTMLDGGINMDAWKQLMRYTGGSVPVAEKLDTGTKRPSIVSDASLHLAMGKAHKVPD